MAEGRQASHRVGEGDNDAARRFLEAEKRRQREAVAEPGLREFFVYWDDITPEMVEAFADVVASARVEADVQRYLAANPALLIQPLSGGHGRWVIPQQRLGSEFVTDFLLAERSSVGFEWTAVELENPNLRMFTNLGDPSRHLTHAVRQIMDWRIWLTDNHDYAERPRSRNGLGLVDISNNIPAWVIIGRRANESSENRHRRRQLAAQNNLEIHTYDWLIERAEARVDELSRFHQDDQGQ